MSLEPSVPFSRDYQNAKQIIVKRKTAEAEEGEFESNSSFYDEQRNKSWDKNFSLCPGHSELGCNRPSQSKLNAYDAEPEKDRSSTSQAEEPWAHFSKTYLYV